MRLGWFLFAGAAHSCPICHTQTGQQVRAGLFDSGFGWNLFVTGLPFPIFAAAVIWVYFSKPKAGSNRTGCNKK